MGCESSDFDFLKDGAQNQLAKLVNRNQVRVRNVWQDDYIAAWDISSCAIMIGDSPGWNGMTVYNDDPITTDCAGNSVTHKKNCE